LSAPAPARRGGKHIDGIARIEFGATNAGLHNAIDHVTRNRHPDGHCDPGLTKGCSHRGCAGIRLDQRNVAAADDHIFDDDTARSHTHCTVGIDPGKHAHTDLILGPDARAAHGHAGGASGNRHRPGQHGGINDLTG
jgi:hypothetical protein